MKYTKDEIIAHLRDWETDNRVSILYACESGSRAWNAESEDSDYDVRFIYVDKLHNYLTITPHKDTCEILEGDLDMVGWDLKKALYLGSKSNPSVLEWMQSPIVYMSDPWFTTQFNKALENFSAKSLMHHYASLANRQLKAYFSTDGDVLLKKYLYAVRPIAAATWMRKNNFQVPPLDINELLNSECMPPDCVKDMKNLLYIKRLGTESLARGRFPRLDAYVEQGISEVREEADLAPAGSIEQSDFNLIFNEAVIRQ